MSEKEQGPNAFNQKWGYPWPVVLRCPFGGHVSLSVYVTWLEVPEWWACACGAEHQKPDEASDLQVSKA